MTTALENRAASLARAGWGPLPLPAGKKNPPPRGAIGADDPLPSFADWHAWLEDPAYRNHTNLGARLPEGVVAVDVDSYKENGLERWHELDGPNWEPTLRVSARGFADGQGHWFYLPPEGRDPRELPSKFGGIEVLRFWHRYTMAPGSWNPDAGAEYACLDMRTGALLEHLPPVSELPQMPLAQWERLVAYAWSSARATGMTPLLPDPEGAQPCGYVATLRLPNWAEGSRYDATRDLVWRLVSLKREGHRGTDAALVALREAYIAELTEHPRKGGQPPAAEFDRQAKQAAEKVALRPATDECRCDLTDATELLGAGTRDGEFWSEREWLGHVWDLAKARMVSPLALLGALLARIAGEVPESVVLPPIAGPTASLNLYVALVGEPSAGKSAAIGVSAEASGLLSHLPDHWSARNAHLGSGEGLVKVFASQVQRTDLDTGEKSWVLQWNDPPRAVAVTDEISVIENLQNRNGATLPDMLRSAWGGNPIGFNYADPSKTVNLPAHSYRLCLIVGAQPDRAEFVLNEHGSGTPQRYLWLNAEDPQMDANAPWVDIAPWVVFPKELLGPRPERTEVTVPDHLRQLVRERRAAAGRKEESAPGQHSDLLRLTLASLFALTDGRMVMNDRDWWLAGWLVARSDRMFASLVTYHRNKRSAANRGRGVARAEADEAGAEHRLRSGAASAARTVQRHTEHPPDNQRHRGAPGCTNWCLRSAIRAPAGVTGRARAEYVAAATALALELGWLEQRTVTSAEAVAREVTKYFPGRSLP